MGISLFDCKELNEMALKDKEYRKQFVQFNLFAKFVHFVSFKPFSSLKEGIEVINLLNNGKLPDMLKIFLNTYISEDMKKKNILLGVCDSDIADLIRSELNIYTISNENVKEVTRGIRLHFKRYFDSLSLDDINQQSLKLSTEITRNTVKFNQFGDCNMIKSSAQLLKSLDSDINNHFKKLTLLYGEFFPELKTAIEDKYTYAKVVSRIGLHDSFNIEQIDFLNDKNLINRIKLYAENTVGKPMMEMDRVRINDLALLLMKKIDYRNELKQYLDLTMKRISPNVSALLGSQHGADMITLAGSIDKLACMEPGVVKVMGTDSNIFVADKDSTRHTKRLANKLLIAARLDAFGVSNRGGHLGAEMKEMIEEQRTGNFNKTMYESVEKSQELEKNDPLNQNNEDICYNFHSKPLPRKVRVRTKKKSKVELHGNSEDLASEKQDTIKDISDLESETVINNIRKMESHHDTEITDENALNDNKKTRRKRKNHV